MGLGHISALENERRRIIHEHVARNPGTTLRAIREATGFARRVIEHHLGVLRANGLVVERWRGRRRAYYLPRAAPAEDRLRLESLVDVDTRRAIFSGLLAADHALTQRELSERTGVPRRLVSYHLGHLSAAGLAEGRAGSPRAYVARAAGNALPTPYKTAMTVRAA